MEEVLDVVAILSPNSLRPGMNANTVECAPQIPFAQALLPSAHVLITFVCLVVLKITGWFLWPLTGTAARCLPLYPGRQIWLFSRTSPST